MSDRGLSGPAPLPTPLPASGAADGARAAPTQAHIELLPNCSLSIRQALLFFASIALASLTFATFFVLQGLWPVLPFAGLELAVLGWALWASLRRRNWTQSILISDADVEIVTRGREGERRIVFSRHWASVTLRGPRSWHPTRLYVESHGRACEVGSFLTDEERRHLWQRLGELIGRTAQTPPLATGRAAAAHEAQE